jgi:hypothetical protein
METHSLVRRVAELRDQTRMAWEAYLSSHALEDAKKHEALTYDLYQLEYALQVRRYEEEWG